VSSFRFLEQLAKSALCLFVKALIRIGSARWLGLTGIGVVGHENIQIEAVMVTTGSYRPGKNAAPAPDIVSTNKVRSRNRFLISQLVSAISKHP
jgi:hypothetical protein